MIRPPTYITKFRIEVTITPLADDGSEVFGQSVMTFTADRDATPLYAIQRMAEAFGQKRGEPLNDPAIVPEPPE